MCVTFQISSGLPVNLTQGNTRVNNLIAGKQYLSVHGALCIKALKGPSRSVHIKYLETGMLSKNQKGQVGAAAAHEGCLLQECAVTTALAICPVEPQTA